MQLASFMFPRCHYTTTSFRFADEVFNFIGFSLHVVKMPCGFSNYPYLLRKALTLLRVAATRMMMVLIWNNKSVFVNRKH